MTSQEFINRYKYDIIRASFGSNLFASVFMGQAILESESGNSVLARKYNNFFGIKAGSSWTGETTAQLSDEFINGKMKAENSSFRVYRTPRQSIKDRAELLIKKYPEVVKAKTAKEQVEKLGLSDYATDPDYSEKLTQVINKYDLLTLDQKKEKMKKIEIIIAVIAIIGALLTLSKHLI